MTHIADTFSRNHLSLDQVPGGVDPDGVEQIAYESDWKQPHCINAAKEEAVVKALPATKKASK